MDSQDVAPPPDLQPVGQVPPLSPAGAVELDFVSLSASLIRVASIGISATTTNYRAGREDWYTVPSLRLAGVTSLAMGYTPVPNVTDALLDRFFVGMVKALSPVGDVTGIEWTGGTFQAPAGTTAYLFTSPDPDDRTRSIGLLLVLSSAATLVKMAWYKAADPAVGYAGSVWLAENMTAAGLTFSFVGSGSGATSPVMPPLRDGTAWYYIAAR